jgi:hypothetical protein
VFPKNFYAMAQIDQWREQGSGGQALERAATLVFVRQDSERPIAHRAASAGANLQQNE